MNNAKLFFGRLNYNTNEEALTAVCSQFGTVVSCKVIFDKMTNRSKGFAFVEMSSEAEAMAVIDALNEREFEGRVIVVNVAKPMEERSNDRNGGGSYGGNRGGSRGGNRY